MGGLRPANPAGGDACAVTVTGRGGATLWHSPSFDGVPAGLELPPPSLARSRDAAVAMRDTPRFVPPPGGAGLPPDRSSNTSGYDIGVHALDLYVFLLSDGLAATRAEVLALTGPVPTLPQWAFGLWFCWYHPYTQAEKEGEVSRMVDEGYGLTIASLDRNWRQLGLPAEGQYLVNTSLFPNMDNFFLFAKARGVKVYFNDHPKWLDVNTSGAGSSDPHVVLSPAELEFRQQGLGGMLNRGLDYWWYDCHWCVSALPRPVPPPADWAQGMECARAVDSGGQRNCGWRHVGSVRFPGRDGCARRRGSRKQHFWSRLFGVHPPCVASIPGALDR